VVTRNDLEVTMPDPTLVKWPNPRRIQEAFHLSVWKAGEQAAPLNTGIAAIIANYEHDEMICGVIGMPPPKERT
jgi:hypothetical protein